MTNLQAIAPDEERTDLLSISNLHVEYPMTGWRKQPFKALNGASLEITPGETMGLVDESGSGETTTGRAVLGLAPIAGGSTTFDARDTTHRSRAERRSPSSNIHVVFQEPNTSLNPARTIRGILAEPLQASGIDRAKARSKIRELLAQVNLPENASNRLPREFFGGQRQRVAIARALALSPRLIVCDEPVPALDLSTQATVLGLFTKIQERIGAAYLLVSHDLSVIRHISHRVAVLYRGEIV